MKIDSYPGSEKTYIPGTLFPNIKVGMRKINLTPTVSVKDNGEKDGTSGYIINYACI